MAREAWASRRGMEGRGRRWRAERRVQAGRLDFCSPTRAHALSTAERWCAWNCMDWSNRLDGAWRHRTRHEVA